MQKIVVLYNDQDRDAVDEVRVELAKRCPGVLVWMASEHLTAFGDIFSQIEAEVHASLGAVIFLGKNGLGRFQENIELTAVWTERWQQGTKYGCLLVHLAPGLVVPTRLLGLVSVNHDGSLTDADVLAAGVAKRFGFEGESPP